MDLKNSITSSTLTDEEKIEECRRLVEVTGFCKVQDFDKLIQYYIKFPDFFTFFIVALT
jgi:hypothetical protein